MRDASFNGGLIDPDRASNAPRSKGGDSSVSTWARANIPQMDEVKKVRSRLLAMTGERWSPDRVSALLDYLPGEKAIAAVQRAARLRKWLEKLRQPARRP